MYCGDDSEAQVPSVTGLGVCMCTCVCVYAWYSNDSDEGDMKET